MPNINDLNQIKDVLEALDNERPARLGYTQAAIEATGAAEVDALTGVFIDEDSSQINSIPTPDLIATDPLVQAIGLRTQAATVSRMMINHYFGRLGLNLLKLTEKVKLLVTDHLVNRYITPTGKVVESIAVSPQATVVNLLQNQSPLAAAEPTTAQAIVAIPAAVSAGNAGVLTGADKKKLDDLHLETARLTDTPQTFLGDMTFSKKITGSITGNADGKAATAGNADTVTNGVYITGDQAIAGKKTFSVIPEGPAADPTLSNQLARKSYVDDKIAAAGAFPIGGIIAYLPGYFTNASNLSFTPVSIALSGEWKVCDGSVCNDIESPIFNGSGRYLPNLSDSRFIMGSTIANAGQSGGNTDNTVALGTGNLPSHTHTIAHTHSFSATSGNDSVSHIHTRAFPRSGSGSSGGARYIGEVTPPGTSIANIDYGANSAAHVHSISGTTGASSNGNSGSVGSGTAFSILPKYLTAAYLIKIK